MRHTTCRILEESGIPCVLWHEDALLYYGVKTDLFDIHILVTDVSKAIETLIHHGYKIVPLKPSDKLITSEIIETPQSLEIPGASCSRTHIGIDPADVVLSTMKDWDFIPLTSLPSPSQLLEFNDI